MLNKPPPIWPPIKPLLNGGSINQESTLVGNHAAQRLLWHATFSFHPLAQKGLSASGCSLDQREVAPASNSSRAAAPSSTPAPGGSSGKASSWEATEKSCAEWKMDPTGAFVHSGENQGTAGGWRSQVSQGCGNPNTVHKGKDEWSSDGSTDVRE